LRDIGIQLDGSILPTPGHTIDSISILFDDGDAVVGDAAANCLHFAGTNYCIVFITDIDKYYDSWRELIAKGAQRIYPAHGKHFSVRKLIQNVGKNKKSAIVTDMPTSTTRS
jgi:glyoxylase-like metal-dependent hydrolase (beta-lactamase superfamily II)